MAASCQHIAILILSCLMLLNSGTDAIYTMDETCTLYSEGYIADPSNCAGWGYCRGGKVIAKGSCTNGLVYNSATGACDYSKDVNCVGNATTMCASLNLGYKPDPNSCSSYCWCVNYQNDGCYSCPDGQIFNPSITQCVWPSAYDCPIDSPCYLVPNNKFVADPNPQNCGNYIRCIGGAGTSAACSGGLMFNPSNGNCDTFTTLNCTGSTTPNAPPTVTPEKIKTTCAGSTTASPDAPEYFDDDATCGGYIACSGDGVGSWQKCPLGTHYNPTLFKCVTPYTFACTYDRCDNLNLKFVTAEGTACGQYFPCQNQLATSTTPYKCSDVSKAYPYYDEYAGGCVANPPSYKICNA